MFIICLSAYAGATAVSSLVRTVVAVSSKTTQQSISFQINDRKIDTDNKLAIGALSVLTSPLTEPFFWYAGYKTFKEGSFEFNYEINKEFKYPKN